MRCTRAWVGAAMACLLGLGAGAARGGETAGRTGDGPEVTEADLRAYLTELASDAFEGRLTCEAGCKRAAEYVAASFQRSGLTPFGTEGGWMQPYVLPRPVLGEGNRLRASGPEGTEPFELAVPADWNPLSVSARGDVTAPLVFAGFGIAAGSDHDDYAGLDVKGKVVLVVRRMPPGKQGLMRHAALLSKLGAAHQRGALAVLVVNDAPTAKADGDAPIPWNQDIGAPAASAALPFASVTRAAAERLLALGGASLQTQEEAAATGKGSLDLPTVRVELTARVSKTEVANTANVVGFLRGRDPEVCHEVVVIGAHHDHLGTGVVGQSLGGKGAEGQVHNGADDNGSGTAALLELAEWFGKGANRPRRSLLFVSFSGEELGLVGSIHYVEHPLVPLEDTVAMVNLDMVGRSKNGNVEVGGVGTAKGLQDLVAAANKSHALNLSWDPQGEAPSDSTSFFRKKIPVLFMFTGLHEDYHRPSDDVEKINFVDLTRITRLTRDVVAEIAEREDRLVYTDPPRPARRPRLGVSLARESHPEGVMLESVVEGGPADRAGIRGGDVLVSIAGQNVRKPQDVPQVVRRLEPGKPVEVVVLRDGVPVTVTVTLDE